MEPRLGPENATFVKTKTVLFFFLKVLQMVTPMKLKDVTYPFMLESFASTHLA